MKYAALRKFDVANGPGVRVSLFVSGCNHKCKGCFNAVAWDFDYGHEFTDETIQKVISFMSPEYIKGLSVLGGEPMDPRNQSDVAKLIQKVKEKYPLKSIWVYSGYTFEELISGTVGNIDVVNDIFEHIEVLVDGPFIEEKKNLRLKFRGSENQRVIDIKGTRLKKDIVQEISL